MLDASDVMPRIRILVLLTVLGLASSRIVCHKNFCSQVKCAPVLELECTQEEKDFRPNSTSCGCCHRCIDYLDDVASCGIKGDRPRLVGGEPPLEPRCRPLSDCLDNVCWPSSASEPYPQTIRQ